MIFNKPMWPDPTPEEPTQEEIDAQIEAFETKLGII